MSYRYPIEKCDVLDKGRLSSFRKKRTEWVDLLEKDKLHSISHQLSVLVWQDAVYRLINETWGLSDIEQPTSSMSPLLVEALTNGYVANLVLGVSRLTDPGKETKKGDQNVVSLRRVFDDIKAHRHLITREVFVCYDGTAYDPYSILPPSLRRGSVMRATGVGGSIITPYLHHRHFDRISGVSPDQRKRDDVIFDSPFTEIDALLNTSAIEKIRLLRNKVVAHAADPRSRSVLSTFGFTLDDARDALSALCRAQHLVQINLLYNTDSDVMPVPQFDIMEYMDQPFLRPQQIEALKPVWQDLVAERRAWSAGSEHS